MSAKAAHYSEKDRDEIIRDYFGPAGTEENPRCPICGEVLRFDTLFEYRGSKFQIRVSCPDCQANFSWEQSQQQPWKSLHLQYFLERYLTNDRIRCPLDDCYVIYTEFSEGVLEFRCPYCNSRGKAQLPARPERS